MHIFLWNPSSVLYSYWSEELYSLSVLCALKFRENTRKGKCPVSVLREITVYPGICDTHMRTLVMSRHNKWPNYMIVLETKIWCKIKALISLQMGKLRHRATELTKIKEWGGEFQSHLIHTVINLFILIVNKVEPKSKVPTEFGNELLFLV